MCKVQKCKCARKEKSIPYKKVDGFAHKIVEDHMFSLKYCIKYIYDEWYNKYHVLIFFVLI